jgi:predicted Rossmann-fold nucleotide-binding protein
VRYCTSYFLGAALSHRGITHVNAGGTGGVLGMGASNVFVGLSVGAVAVFMI